MYCNLIEIKIIQIIKMLFRNLLPFEILIMEKFVAFKIREMVSILYKDKGGYIPRMYISLPFKQHL